jgi:hypothetical protein
VPDIGQHSLSAFTAIYGEAVSQRHSINGPTASAADTFNHQAIIFQQSIEHAPSERTMRTTTLQC